MALFAWTRFMIVALGVGLVLLNVVGLLDHPVFRTAERPAPLAFHYLRFQGPFSSIPASFSKLAACLPAGQSLESVLTIGVYFDDPNVVPSDKLRYWLGFVGTPVPNCEGLRSFTGTLGTVLQTDMPIRHLLSPALLPHIVYGPMINELSRRGWKISNPLELYDLVTNTVSYVQPKDNPIKEW